MGAIITIWGYTWLFTATLTCNKRTGVHFCRHDIHWSTCISSLLIEMQNIWNDKWRLSSSWLKSRPALSERACAFRLCRVCKQKAPQTAFAVISCFASWMGVIGTMCLHTKLDALSKAAKQIEPGDGANVSIRMALCVSPEPWLIDSFDSWRSRVLRVLTIFPFQEMGWRWTWKQGKKWWVKMWNDNCNVGFLSPHRGGQETDVTGVRLRLIGSGWDDG